jgi:exonuclease III
LARQSREDTFQTENLLKIVSWNVNGIRAILRKNFLEFLAIENPTFLCMQETRADPDEIEQLWPAAYTTYWNVAQKKGYAGDSHFHPEAPAEGAEGNRVRRIRPGRKSAHG